MMTTHKQCVKYYFVAPLKITCGIFYFIGKN